MDASFSRINRLVSKQDFQSVFAKPYKVTQRYLLALFCPNSLPHARLGIIIAKHHVKKSVARNRLRRVIRESFRQHKEALKGLDIIVLIRSECTAQSAESGKTLLRTDVDKLWQAILSKKP